MKRTIAVGLMLALTALLGCNKGDSAGSSGGASGGGGDIGIKECDDYIAKWNACYKDPAMKAAAKPAFDTIQQQWREQAKDPNQKAGLKMACKSMVDNFPSSSCK
ncbi:MAG TPA: hypothetical protein VIF15_09440 [Polyangiaceae bacterium]|jgi:hypothetical protein